MKEVNFNVFLVQPLIPAKATAKRRNKDTGRTEFLLSWTGAAGEPHEHWYDESLVKKVED